MRSILLLPLLGACTVTSAVPRRSTTTSPASTTTSTSTSTLPRDRHFDPDAPFVGSDNHLQPGEHASRAEKNCDGAHDHCLPIGTVFAQDLDVGDNVYVAWPTDDGPWAYVRLDVVRGNRRTLVTERATTHNVSIGALVVYYGDGGTVPLSEASAASGQWTVGTIDAVDGDTLRVGDVTVLIAGARVVTETK